ASWTENFLRSRKSGAKMPQDKQSPLEGTRKLMKAMLHRPPKLHEEMKVGKKNPPKRRSKKAPNEKVVQHYCNERCSSADVHRLKNRPVLALRGMLFQPLSGSLLEAPDNNQGVFKFLYFFFGVVRFW